MSSEEPVQDVPKQETEPTPRLPTEPAAMAAIGNKKRPRLDLDANLGGGRERKRGKSMFGLLVGTLNKAKIEDKERNASEAAKKRQLIEQRLQNKLRKETDSVRRAEEAKKDKMAANRKEEELQLKDSIYKYRRTRLPLLSNFLVTSDNISFDDSSTLPSSNVLSLPPRSHPPPLYFLPKILTPAQEAFVARRKSEVPEAAEHEWKLFRIECDAGISDVNQLRQRVADEEERKKTETKQENDEMDTDPAPAQPATSEDIPVTETSANVAEPASDANPEKSAEKDHPVEQEKKEEPTPMQADDDDAVEY